jgi:hypothetical protein
VRSDKVAVVSHRSAAELYGLADLLASYEDGGAVATIAVEAVRRGLTTPGRSLRQWRRWRAGTTCVTARLWPINCWLTRHERPASVRALGGIDGPVEEAG